MRRLGAVLLVALVAAPLLAPALAAAPTVRVLPETTRAPDASPGDVLLLNFTVASQISTDQTIRLEVGAPSEWAIAFENATRLLPGGGSTLVTVEVVPGGGRLVGGVTLKAAGPNGVQTSGTTFVRTPVAVSVTLDRAVVGVDEPVRGNVTLAYLDGAPGAGLEAHLTESLRAESFRVGVDRNTLLTSGADGRTPFTLGPDPAGPNAPGRHRVVVELVQLRTSSGTAEYSVHPQTPQQDQPAACEGLFLGPGVDPVVNGGFDVGSPEPVVTDGAVGLVLDGGGGVAPGLTEHNATVAAAGWTAVRDRGDERAASQVRWVQAAGGESARLRIVYSSADSGLDALAVAQALGSPLAGSAYCGATSVVLAVRTDAPVLLAAAVYTAERPELPYLAPAVEVAAGGWREVALPVPEGASTLTQLRLLLHDAGASDGATVELDDVRLLGARTGRVRAP